ncbi:protein NRT1/ PTR FAMILY 2.7-like [Cucumis melo var. makuwa]|uniref:Protein NRT1/ PTR FAMILY 2.7-like n=2 Tax=Cucumis melo TaxID=3656 RepID=A0A5A7SWV6_CUCMM|nr:protein NRT1/ PTR FAMILY 2.7-like [Cucumis melo var. makuwa]
MGEGKRLEEEAQTSKRHGGWITFPFIIGSFACMTLATGGWLSNLIVYLIKEYNINSIDATLIFNIVSGCLCVFPVVGAVLADSFFGSFFVVAISTSISLLAMISLTLTATIHSLRPQPCDHDNTSITCSSSPSRLQYTILYSSIILACLGSGGSRFTTATFGANQYDTTKDQNIFFNWFFVTLYAGFVASSTAIVYIQDNVSWGWGFGISLAANLIALAIFLLGNRFYRLDKPIGSPFTSLARVLVATTRKSLARVQVGSDEGCYYYGDQDHRVGRLVVDELMLTKSFRCLNRAALITQGDVHLDGTIAKPWRLCKVQEVEDFKTLLKIFPLWSTSIFLSVPIAIQGSLTVLQALTMDRHLGPNFKIPAGSFSVIIFISTTISLTLVDRFLYPIWQKLIGRMPRPLERIGLGHVLNFISMVVSALVESKRLKIAHVHHLQGQVEAIVPISALWLFPQLVLVGMGEAFHFPGQVGLYYQEFPMSLRSTATAMISLVIAVAYYLSTGLIDLLHKVTKWLPDDINQGRLDNVYWMISVIGVINFGYYLVCARCYKYQNVEDGGKNINDSITQH